MAGMRRVTILEGQEDGNYDQMVRSAINMDHVKWATPMKYTDKEGAEREGTYLLIEGVTVRWPGAAKAPGKRVCVKEPLDELCPASNHHR